MARTLLFVGLADADAEHHGAGDEEDDAGDGDADEDLLSVDSPHLRLSSDSSA